MPDNLRTPAPDIPADTRSVYDWSWFRRGMARIFSLPALILVSGFVGFGGLARESGVSLPELIFMVPAIWALPSHLLIVAGIASGASLVTLMPAVALASVRMMPMTMALVPDIRTPRSRMWHLLAVSHMVAITAWLHTLQKAPEIPRRGRLPYFVGFGCMLMLCSTVVAALVFKVAAALPEPVMAGLYFITPIYFATSLWGAVRFRAEHLALVLGFMLGPLMAWVVPQANILVGGIAGGAIAYGIHRFAGRSGQL